MVHLSARGLAIRTIAGCLATPTFSSRLMVSFPGMHDWENASSPPADQRRSIAYWQLGNLMQAIQTICHTKFEVALFRAVVVVNAFWGSLRMGKLVVQL